MTNFFFRFYGVATLQEPLMVLMEVCKEGALDSYLKKVKQPVEKLTEMVVQAAWGLEYIHRNNVRFFESFQIVQFRCSIETSPPGTAFTAITT